MDLPNVNEQIKAKKVRLIGEDGKQIGIVDISEALSRANVIGLDLVEIAPQANPPVCKLMDFGKYKYDKRRKERDARKKQKQIEIKQITMKVNIEDHDLKIKVKHAIEFLEHDNKVKFILRLRGREIEHKEKIDNLFDRIIEFLGDIAIVEKKPELGGRQVTMMVAPNKKKGKQSKK